jgi:hypothetical protein
MAAMNRGNEDEMDAKEQAQRKADDEWMREHETRPLRYALQTPSGNLVGMGREKPQLSKQDKRDGWRVIALGR